MVRLDADMAETENDPCGFGDAVDQEAINNLSDEQVDQVLAILSKLK